jgi:TolB-like protein
MPMQRLVFGPFTLDADRGTLLRDGRPMAIGHRALQLLQALAAARGQVVTKAELMEAAWPRAIVEESNLSVQIAALRKLLDDGAQRETIATVARVGYRFCLPVAEAASSPEESSAGALPLGASIGVLPLANLGADPQQEYFADGVTEDIIMALSRFRWFRVMGRSSSFAFKGQRAGAQEIAHKLHVRYLLEGSVRRAGDGVRISLHLVDGESGTQLWGERYDFDAPDLLVVQERIAEQVAGAIEPELLKSEAQAAASRPDAANATALDLVHRGTWLFHQVHREGHLQAREMFREACRLDPASAQANFWLARVSAGIVAYGWSNDEAHDLQEGMAAAARAIRADEKHPYAHYALAITSVYASQFDQAIRAARRAVQLTPGFALGHLVLGLALLYSGDAAAALPPLAQGLRLNAFDPQNFVWHTTLAWAQLFCGDARGGLESARQAQEIRRDWRSALESAACCLVALGEPAAAQQAWRELEQLARPASDVLSPMRHHNPNWDGQIVQWLREAEVGGDSPM